MTYNRPWSIWWNFTLESSHIIIQTDHPDYQDLHYIYKFTVAECEDGRGYIDNWVKTWFNKFRDDVMSGRKNIHTIMKDAGHEKLRDNFRKR
jgi:hypothetical protein